MTALNIPFLGANLQGVIQDGLLERRFHEALKPLLVWRLLCEQVRHTGRIGELVQMTRPGLITPDDENSAGVTAGQEPGVVTRSIERFTSQPTTWSKSINIDLPSSYEAQANLFLDDMEKMVFHAAQTMGRIARNAILRAYTGGDSFAMTTQGGGGSTTLPVKDVSGFDTVLDANGLPQTVSSSNPLPITVNGVAVNVTACGGTAGKFGQYGAGNLTLDVAQTWTKYDLVQRVDAPKIIRANSRATAHLLVAGDVPVMQQFRNARAYLRNQNVPGVDGTRMGSFGCYVDPDTKNALLADPEFHDAIKGQGLTGAFVEGEIGTFQGVTFVENTEMTKIAIDSDYQTTVHRSFMFGLQPAMETYVPEPDFAAEVTPEGIATASHYKAPVDDGVITSVIRAPLDALGRRLVASWVANTGYTVPTDKLALTGPARVKRAVVIETAGPA